jgi:anthranilate synthase component 1
MRYPSKKEFIKLAKKGNLIPVYAEILADFETPLSAFARMADSPYSFLLESIEGGERIARYSFLGSDPSLVFSCKGSRVTIRERAGERSFLSNDPIGELDKLLSRYKFVRQKRLPRFTGGLVGYFGYDMVRFVEMIPDKNPDELNVPDAVFMLADTILIFDHVDHRIRVVSNAYVGRNASASYDEAAAKIQRILSELKKGAARKAPAVKRAPAAGPPVLRSNFTEAGFKKIVEKAKAYIKKGDIIQAVLSQRFSAPVKSSPFDIYRSLRSVNPSPYMYYLKLGNFSLVGSSPEIMVRCEDGRVELRPIAGTRLRGASEDEDRKLEKELLADPKERAEHIMLVDLGRNDIGRVCGYRTVKVSDFMTVERYSHVMHIVSDVSGCLKKGKSVFDVVRAAFPAGTVTGAPKVRAMEIIDELENTRRGPYAGSVGYFSFSGNLDSCITIRTILIKDGIAYIQAGAGIVADSVPSLEYQETRNKARALVKAIEMSEGGLE